VHKISKFPHSYLKKCFVFSLSAGSLKLARDERTREEGNSDSFIKVTLGEK
jgi:hypothetical protein